MSVEIVFAAVGDPTRRAIVEMLSRSDATVNELAEPFDMTLQAVAKHVKILQSAGVIRKKKIGRSHHCSLNQDALLVARVWLQDMEKEWASRLDRLGAFLDENAGKRGPTDKLSGEPASRTAGSSASSSAGGSSRNGQTKKR